MAIARIIAVNEDATVVLSDNDSSLIVKAGIRVRAPSTEPGVDASFGFGGSISVFGSVEGTWGVFDASSTRSSYDVYVHAGAAITATLVNGIGLGLGGNVTNHGQVIAKAIGISMGDAENNTIVNTGLIKASRAMEIHGSHVAVINSGTITATSGIMLYAGDVVVTNSGTITAPYAGIFMRCSPGTVNTFINTGLITSDKAIWADTGNDTVINHGTLAGEIILWTGDDLLDNRDGVITGQISLGGGDDTAYGGVGDEIFYGESGDDLIDGGGGSDTVIYSGASSVAVDLGIATAQETGQGKDILVRIENIWSGDGADVLTGNGGDNAISGNGGNDAIAGMGGSDTLVGGKGDDEIDGGAGVNTAGFSGKLSDYVITHSNGIITVSDTRVGQDGADHLKNIRFAKFSDTIIALTNSAPVDVALSKDWVAENTLISTIVASLSSTDADGDAVTYTLVANANGTFALDGLNLILNKTLDYETQTQQSVTILAKDAWGGETTKTFTIAVTDIADTPAPLPPVTPTPPVSPTLPNSNPVPLILTGTSSADTLTGQTLNDILRGLAGNDTLVGNNGNDMLYGGVGRDVLFGGSGEDIFVFDTKPNKATNLDRIADFSVADDTIHLAKSAFAKIVKKGVLAASAFHVGTTAHDASDRIIYNKKIGALFYDSDGNGSHAAIQIASLPKNLKMTCRDFFVI